MTKVLEDQLNALAKSHMRVLVSDCNLSPAGNEKAIFMIPIGMSNLTQVRQFESQNKYFQ
jgi:hypothetical protein